MEDSTIALSVDSLDIVDVDDNIFTLAILAGDNYTIEGLVVSPNPNYNGTLIVPVTISDGDSVSAPFNLNIVVVPVNDTPLPFNLLTPENGTEIVVTLLDIMNSSTLEVSWSSSFDADEEDELIYSLKLAAMGYDTVLVNTPDTSINITYELLVATLDSLGMNQGDLIWTVFVSDGIDTVNSDDQFTIHVNAVDVLGIDEPLIPEVYALHQNYPNPFNPTTKIKYDLPENTHVTLVIYDIMGRQVHTLFSNHYQEAGYRYIVWNGLDQFGQPLASGMYFYRIQAGDFIKVRKMILLK